MSWLRDTVNINTVLANLEKEIEQVDELANSSILNIADSDNTEDIKVLALLLANTVRGFSSYWNNYCKTFREAVDIDKENIENKLYQQGQQILSLTQQLDDAREEIARLLDIINKQPSDEVISRCLGLLDEVETNVKVISFQRKLKEPRESRIGENAPGWKPVSNDDLVKAYQDAGNKITGQMEKDFGLTHPAIRARLIKLGVYVNKWSNK